jgi:hypothetical protein
MPATQSAQASFRSSSGGTVPISVERSAFRGTFFTGQRSSQTAPRGTTYFEVRSGGEDLSDSWVAGRIGQRSVAATIYRAGWAGWC